jgi:hypothetical protein
VTIAEKYDVVGLKFGEDVGFGVVVDGEISGMRGLWNYKKENGNEY